MGLTEMSDNNCNNKTLINTIYNDFNNIYHNIICICSITNIISTSADLCTTYFFKTI